MGTQKLYVGYIPHVEMPTTADSVDDRKGHIKMGNYETDPSNSFVSVKDLMQHFHDLAVSANPASRAAWAQTQQQLQAMNAYGADKRINFGAWDGPKDSAALQSAIQGYLQGGPEAQMMTFEEFVKHQAAQGAANGLDQPPKNNGFKATSPADIQMLGDQQSQGMLGHSMNAGDSSALVGAVQGQQESAFNAGDVYMRSVTPQSVAREYVLQNNLPEYAQHQVESYANVFANMFLSGTSARANTSLGDAAVGG